MKQIQNQTKINEVSTDAIAKAILILCLDLSCIQFFDRIELLGDKYEKYRKIIA